MMFLIAPGRRCSRRRNSLLGTVLGLFSSLMIGAAAIIQRHDGAHWPVAVAGFVCAALIGLALIRLVALNRDGDGK